MSHLTHITPGSRIRIRRFLAALTGPDGADLGNAAEPPVAVTVLKIYGDDPRYPMRYELKVRDDAGATFLCDLAHVTEVLP